MVLVVGRSVLDIGDGVRVGSGPGRDRAGSDCAVILVQEPPLLGVNRVIELVGSNAPVLVDGVGAPGSSPRGRGVPDRALPAVFPPFLAGNIWAAWLGFPRYGTEAATLSGAPAVGVAWARSGRLPPGEAEGYCARVPRIPPSTAAKRKMVVWLMVERRRAKFLN